MLEYLTHIDFQEKESFFKRYKHNSKKGHGGKEKIKHSNRKRKTQRRRTN